MTAVPSEQNGVSRRRSPIRPATPARRARPLTMTLGERRPHVFEPVTQAPGGRASPDPTRCPSPRGIPPRGQHPAALTTARLKATWTIL